MKQPKPVITISSDILGYFEKRKKTVVEKQ